MRPGLAPPLPRLTAAGQSLCPRDSSSGGWGASATLHPPSRGPGGPEGAESAHGCAVRAVWALPGRRGGLWASEGDSRPCGCQALGRGCGLWPPTGLLLFPPPCCVFPQRGLSEVRGCSRGLAPQPPLPAAAVDTESQGAGLGAEPSSWPPACSSCCPLPQPDVPRPGDTRTLCPETAGCLVPRRPHAQGVLVPPTEPFQGGQAGWHLRVSGEGRGNAKTLRYMSCEIKSKYSNKKSRTT